MGRLSEAIAADPARYFGALCTVAKARAQLGPDDLTDLDAALAQGVPSSAICRALDQIGVHVTQGSMQRHRRGDCTCGRPR